MKNEKKKKKKLFFNYLYLNIKKNIQNNKIKKKFFSTFFFFFNYLNITYFLELLKTTHKRKKNISSLPISLLKTVNYLLINVLDKFQSQIC
jgi:hypothetical protein